MTEIIEDILLWHHLDEMAKKHVEAYNIGWGSGENFVTSKTSKNYALHSEISPRKAVVTHCWYKRRLQRGRITMKMEGKPFVVKYDRQLRIVVRKGPSIEKSPKLTWRRTNHRRLSKNLRQK